MTGPDQSPPFGRPQRVPDRKRPGGAVPQSSSIIARPAGLSREILDANSADLRFYQVYKILKFAFVEVGDSPEGHAGLRPLKQAIALASHHSGRCLRAEC